MRIRKVSIVKNTSIADMGALSTHPHVKKYWPLPLGYTLLEFYHPVFERIYDSDITVANAARAEPTVKTELAEAVAEERALLAPLYQRLDRPADALMLLVPSQTAMYSFLGLGKKRIQWPYLGCSAGWETAQSIRVTGHQSSAAAENVEELTDILRKWTESMRILGELIGSEQLTRSERSFNVKCQFRETSGDATMALFMLLTDTRYLTALKAVGFFLPGDLCTPFAEIGGPGKICQGETA